MILELHSAVLRNLAQAAIKLELWGEAIDAADRVLEMNSDDHKAWFRKACALEGLGNFTDARVCLDRIEEIAVGRPDRDRLMQDCRKKKDKYQVEEERHRTRQQRMVQRGLQKGIFSSERSALAAEQQGGHAAGVCSTGTEALHGSQPKLLEQLSAPKPSSPAEMTGAVDTDRKRITRDSAWDLLDDLQAAYTDPWFVKRVDKLAVDVAFDARRFVEHLAGVALDAQRPVLEKWGFEASAAGLLEMRAALRDHSKGDPKMKEKADVVHKALHGSPQLNMYERVMLGV
mmetsp:Transcript_49623/g.153448  ORF Transcript_49623/g.153448 Transcript_49623/m.153448 type:complete len:287 (+) Transcript_49623:1-861(+)